MTGRPLGNGGARGASGSSREAARHLPPAGLLLLACLAASACLAILVAASPASAQAFPVLSGRVVDEAGLLTSEERARIEAKLKAHEDKTSDQVVVATIRSLGGTSVEDYANRLFRGWKLGRPDKNNGALLVVAPAERKVRIEVGYGLEGALTDALAGVIVRTAIAPKLKNGDVAGGIEAGVDAMLSILTGDAAEWHRRAEIRRDDPGPIDPVTILVLLVIFVVVVSSLMRSRAPARAHRGRGGWVVLPGPSGGFGGGGFGGGFGGGGSFSGGGFSGGGGSSGGGGASGDW